MKRMDSSIAQQYEALRRKLLDTSLRSRMISYRPARVSSIEFLPKEPASLFRLLCADGKSFTFTGQPDPPSRSKRIDGAGPFDSSPELEEEFEMKARQELGDFLENPLDLDMLNDPAPLADTRLSTPHTVSNLQKRLTKIWRDSRALMEESGLNVLFLALGSLTWREAGKQEERVAPLVFVPCLLDRQANGQFRMKHDGGELGSNLALAVLVKEQFGLELPEWEDDGSAPSYFALVEERISRMPGWKVDPTFAALGFFQFTKLVMYEDLNLSRWPMADSPLADGDIQALLGEGYPQMPPVLPEGACVDDHRPVEACYEIYDCDSSQALALLTAKTGESMVIEGPPGTGKSQTIANLIADSIASGKRVLFVSEKLAALDVVYRRLSEAGLADACLQLHSRGSRRKGFYEELKRIMSLNRSYTGSGQTLKRLDQLRKELNDTCAAVSSVIEPFGLSPHQAVGELMALSDPGSVDPAALPDFQILSGFSWQALQSARPELEACHDKIAEIGRPENHAFYGSALTLLTQLDDASLRSIVEKSCSLAAQFRPSASDLAARLHLPSPTHLSSAPVLARCARIAADAPEPAGLSLMAAPWEDQDQRIRELISRLERLHSIIQKRSNEVRQTAWTADLGPTLHVYREWADKWHKILMPSWHKERSRLAPLLTAAGPQEPEAQRDLLEDLILAQTERALLAESDSLLQSLFGPHWKGEATSPARLTELMNWALSVRQEAIQGRVPPEFLNSLSAGITKDGLLESAHDQLQIAKELSDLLESIQQTLQWKGGSLELMEIPALQEMLVRWKEGANSLPGLTQFNIIKGRLIQMGLGRLIPWIESRPQTCEFLPSAISRAYLQGFLKQAVTSLPALATFERRTHELKAAEFRSLDSVVLGHNRARVIATHLQGLPNWDLGMGNLGLLKRQTELKKGHKPIRWAMERAGEAIQRMKPVFLMSPLSVAQFLPPGSVSFDAVIFDEASQIKPEDALCSIIRAKQSIVVGDSKQMPPTSFFDHLVYSEDDEAPDEVQSLGGLESILNLMNTASHGSRSAGLRWHYRSLHPSLIEPSNQAFYDGDLVIFPSADRRSNLGLRLRHQPQHVYDRGQTRTNKEEALSVASAALEHAKTEGHLSLGIAAFSKAQQEAIQDALDLLRSQTPGILEAFDERHQYEPLFVKNLETVQGDERDVIFVSVGYGKDQSGRLTMNFGPVNAEGGERRLNVLMTRARMRCEVFSSILASDIKLSDDPSQGLSVLRNFLGYAEQGMEWALVSGGSGGSQATSSLARRLRSLGLEVSENVGPRSCQLDLTVKPGDEVSGHLLGVELDGSSCASARSCRDREKLRPEALAKRGFHLHRTWTLDLWQNPDEEAARIQARALAMDEEDPEKPESEADEEEPEAEFEELLTLAPPVLSSSLLLPDYQVWNSPSPPRSESIADLTPQEVAALAWEVVRVEGPVHQDLVLLRLKSAFGASRSGARIQTAFGLGLEHALKNGPLLSMGSFLFLPDQRGGEPRSRGSRPSSERRPDWIPPVELEEVHFRAIAGSMGIEPEEAMSLAWRMLGFQRRSAHMTQLARLALAKLVQEGRAHQEEGILVLPQAPPRKSSEF